jgi:hypothetical protein
MFNFTVHNPNNIMVTNGDIYTVPIGVRCASALACKYANIRKFSLPFDWTFPLFPSKVKDVLKNDFKDYIPDVNNDVFVNKYNIVLAHFNPNKQEGIEEYNRRIQRFNAIMTETHKKKYFVYINEDYLYDPEYRKDEFNDKIFNEMLDLENFIKTKYPGIKYTILYLNFRKENIPPNSNIINFVLHSDKFYDDCIIAPYENLRNFCGGILALLFGSQLNIGYHFSEFYN